MDKLRTHVNALTLGPRCQGMEVRWMQDGNCEVYVTTIKRKAETLEIELTQRFSNLTEAMEGLEKIPLLLTVTGKGVLTKNMGHLEEPASLQKAFPTLDLLQVTHKNYSIGDEDWVCIVRNELLSSVVSGIEQAGVPVVCIEVGALHAVSQSAHFSEAPSRLGTHHYTWNGDRLTSYQFNKQEDDEASELFYGHDLNFAVSMLAGFEFFRWSMFRPAHRSNARFRVYYSRKLQLAGMLAYGGLLLLLLLISIGSIQHSRQQRVALESEVSMLSEQVGDMRNEGEMATMNEELFRSLVPPTAPGHAEMLEHIASSVPKAVRLTGIELFPRVDRQSGSDKVIRYDKSKIVISGQSTALDEFTQFIEALDQTTWTREVKLRSLEYVEKESHHAFQLHISL